MSVDTGRVKLSRFSSDSEEQKQVLQETVILCVLEINWLAARETPFSSSKTTCNISTTSFWVLKLKGTPFKFDSLRFKANKYINRLILVYFYFAKSCVIKPYKIIKSP